MIENGRKYSFLFVSAPFSGIEVFMRNLKTIVDELPNIEAEWVFTEKEPPEWYANIPPFSSNWTLKGGVVARERVLASERSHGNFDAAFVNHLIPLFLLRRFRRRVPTVMSLDATPILLERYSSWYLSRQHRRNILLHEIKRRIAHSAYHDAARLLAWSNPVKGSLVIDYGVEPSKINILPPGINLKFWSIRQGRNLWPRNGGNVLFVGGDFLRKGGDRLVSIAKRPEFADSTFHFVTGDRQETIGKNIRFYHSMKPNSDELKSLYELADVFVLPTHADLAPTNALCEAMAMELPVMVTDVGGLSDIVSDGVNGYLLPNEDNDELAFKLKSLLQQPDLRIRLGQTGRKLVKERFDLHKNARAVIQALVAACQAKRSCCESAQEVPEMHEPV